MKNRDVARFRKKCWSRCSSERVFCWPSLDLMSLHEKEVMRSMLNDWKAEGVVYNEKG